MSTDMDGTPYSPSQNQWVKKIEKSRQAERERQLQPYLNYHHSVNCSESFLERGKCWPTGSSKYFSWTKNAIFYNELFPDVVTASSNSSVSSFDISVEKGTKETATRMVNEIYVVTGGYNPEKSQSKIPTIVKYDMNLNKEIFRIPLPVDIKKDTFYSVSIIVHGNGKIYITCSRFLFEIEDDKKDKIIVNRYDLHESPECYADGLTIMPTGYLVTTITCLESSCESVGNKAINKKCNKKYSVIAAFNPAIKKAYALQLENVACGIISGATFQENGKIHYVYSCMEGTINRFFFANKNLVKDTEWTPSYKEITSRSIYVVKKLHNYMVGITNSDKPTNSENPKLVIFDTLDMNNIFMVEIDKYGKGKSWPISNITCDEENNNIYIADGFRSFITCFKMNMNQTGEFAGLETIWTIPKRSGSLLNLIGPPGARQLIHTEIDYPASIVIGLCLVYIAFSVIVVLLFANDKYKCDIPGLTLWIITITCFTLIMWLTFESTCARFSHIGDTYYSAYAEDIVWRNAQNGKYIKKLLNIPTGIGNGVQPFRRQQYIYPSIISKNVTIVEMENHI